MAKKNIQINLSTLIQIIIGLVFVLAAVMIVFLVNRNMRQQALVEAESKARVILDLNLATHTYFSQQLKPKLFKFTEYQPSYDYFEPTWMSSTYAIREIYKYFKSFREFDYYYKECAINARSPENEADADERVFLEELGKNSELTVRSGVRYLDGKPYFIILRRGESMEKSCLRCHGNPEQAPRDLITYYGPERSFHRKEEDVVHAISIRVPVSAAYAEANRFAVRLSGLLLIVLLGLFAVQFWLNKRFLFTPLTLIRNQMSRILADDKHLGEKIPLPFGRELKELTDGFNTMSVRLRGEIDGLEKRVQERTVELKQVNDLLEQDIAERKQAEEALKKSVQLLRDTGEMANVGAWELDLSTKEVLMTEEVCRIHGVEPGYKPKLEEAIKFYAPESIPDLKATLKKTTETGEPYDLESLFIPRGSKDKIWVRSLGKAVYSGGKIVKLAGTFQNIDKYKRAEEALRVALTKYETLFDSFPLGITVSDKAGKILETNPMAERLLGVPQEEHGERKIDGQEWRIVRPDGTPMPAEEYASVRALKENRLVENVEMGIVKARGEVTWISVTAAPIPLEGYGVAIAYGDITERKQAEEEKLRLEERSRKVVEDIFRFIPEGVLVFSRKMELLRQNEAFRELVSGYAKRLGFAEDELENLIIDKIKAGMGDKKIKEIRVSRKHETWK